MKYCEIADCNSKHYGGGFCSKHYQEQWKHPLYSRWSGMIQRCTNPKNTKYRNYGGRGIKVCDRWRNFKEFVKDVGMPPTSKHTLERIDNDGDYEPNNVRWATYTEQNLNQRLNKRNKSGARGVSWDKNRNKWAVDVKLQGKRFRGRFSTRDEAISARELWFNNLKEEVI